MRTLITNIGALVSGDIDAPIADADSILVEDGRIAVVGRGLDGDAGTGGHLDQTIDAKGATALPGLIDSHAHPVFGDFTPRQQMLNFIESGLHGGVTSVISAGEVHLPGRPEGHRRPQGTRDRGREGVWERPARRRQGESRRADS